MKRSLFAFIFLVIANVNNGQTLDSLTQQISRNNPGLIAIQKWVEAEKASARTGIAPDNPEISYIYLFGNSTSVGDQQEFEIIQPFRYPGYYTAKSEVQQLQLEQKVLMAENEVNTVMYAVRELYFNLIFLTRKEVLLKERNAEAGKLVDLLEDGYRLGEISKASFDKARIYRIKINSEWQKTISDINIQSAQLEQMNGAIPIHKLSFEYPIAWILPDLDSMLMDLPAQNPVLRQAVAGMDENEKLIRFEKMNFLPTLAAGYKSETVLSQNFKGIHAGITIPLWQNDNRIKHARLKSEWSKAYYDRKKNEIESRVHTLYNEAKTLYMNFTEMKHIVEGEQVSKSSLELLRSGQISFPEYMMEVQFIMDTHLMVLETEMKYYSTVNEIKLITNY